MGAGKVGHRRIIDASNEAIALANKTFDAAKKHGTAIDALDTRVQNLANGLQAKPSFVDIQALRADGKALGDRIDRLVEGFAATQRNQREDFTKADEELAARFSNYLRGHEDAHRFIHERLTAIELMTFRQRLAWLFTGRVPFVEDRDKQTHGVSEAADASQVGGPLHQDSL